LPPLAVSPVGGAGAADPIVQDKKLIAIEITQRTINRRTLAERIERIELILLEPASGSPQEWQLRQKQFHAIKRAASAGARSPQDMADLVE
jgi:hypothetical protein